MKPSPTMPKAISGASYDEDGYLVKSNDRFYPAAKTDTFLDALFRFLRKFLTIPAFNADHEIIMVLDKHKKQKITWTRAYCEISHRTALGSEILAELVAKKVI